jgi:TRAP transporter TAXI family solute receptor
MTTETIRWMRGLAGAVAALVLLIAAPPPPAAAQSAGASVDLSLPGAAGDRLLIGGGLPFGLYFPMAGTLCRLVETGPAPQPCAVASLPDSAAAIAALQAGEMPYAIVQSDWLHHAVQGTSRYRETGPAGSLRAVAAFYTEAFSVFVKSTGPIATLDDLDEKRVSVGPAGSYRGILADVALDAAGLDREDLAAASAEPVMEAIERLCNGETDAVVVMAVHPAELLASAGRRCGIAPLSLTDGEVDDMLSSLPGYAGYTIPARTYPGQTVPVRTVGLRPVLTTMAGVDAARVEALTTAITRGLARLNAAHPAFSTVTVDDLTETAAFAPMHPGAARALGVTGQ